MQDNKLASITVDDDGAQGARIVSPSGAKDQAIIQGSGNHTGEKYLENKSLSEWDNTHRK